MQRGSLLIVLFVFFAACTKNYIPKPKGYNRIDLPAHQYQMLSGKHPFLFEYPKSALLSPHVSWLSEPHWIDIKYPDLNATVEITYKDLRLDENALNGVLNDAHRLTNKHNIKAYSIEESIIKTKNGHEAAIFELTGEVPSQFQFFVTDSTVHFLRGALYFPVSTKNDSLAPAIDFVKQDIIHLLNTLEWKAPEAGS